MDKVCHFSCGAASAVAMLITSLDHDVEGIYADPGAEHPDNHRFMADIESMSGLTITKLKSAKYDHVDDVFHARQYLAGVNGAPCTVEMKKEPIRDYLDDRLYSEPQIFGFTNDKKEQNRAERYINNNPLMTCEFPLIEHGLDKDDCYYIIKELGIQLPYMYRIGYANANCIGCVKAENISYWAAIRQDFPERFKFFAEFERQIGAIDKDTGNPKGCAINKQYRKCVKCQGSGCSECKNGEVRHRVFLDEIPDGQPLKRTVSFTCGYTCGASEIEIDTEEQLGRSPTFSAYDIAERIKAKYTPNQ